MDFATLALITVMSTLGPLLALPPRWHLPVLLGELSAGVVLGSTGFRVLHADNGTFTFLANIGFALVMFVAGSHVPIRDPALRAGLVPGGLRAAAVGLIATGLGVAVSAAFGTGHPALYAVLMASSSAALVLPVVVSLHLGGRSVLQLLPQVAIADTVCIVALPLAIDPQHAGRAALGSLAVLGCAAAVYVGLRYVETSGIRHRVHDVSEDRKFALELRINLAILFALTALAVRTHVSIMLAGFSFGLAMAAVGEPRRLARQLFAVTDGLFAPLFFVWLGASLDVRDLGHHPSYIVLGLALGIGAIAAHAAMRVTSQPLPIAVMAGAQLGVPVAATTVGTQLHLLRAGESGALILGALITVATTVACGGIAARVGGAGPVTEGADDASPR